MKKELLLICFLSIGISAIAQNLIVSGRVTDASTGEILSDVNIVDKKAGVGVTSNAYGLYSIRVKEDMPFMGNTNFRNIKCSLTMVWIWYMLYVGL